MFDLLTKCIQNKYMYHCASVMLSLMMFVADRPVCSIVPLLFYLFRLLLHEFYSLVCLKKNKETVLFLSSACCLQSFCVEHIIMFDDYFPESERYNFVLAALGSNYSWQILPRYNVLSNLPSDFDVIRVGRLLCFLCLFRA